MPMQETYNEIWREIASEIRLHLSADAFQRWFSAIELVQADEIALTFQVPNTIYQFWIESNYLNLVESAAMSVLGSPREIKFRAADSGLTGPVVDAHADRLSETLAPTSQDEDSEGAINHGMNPRNRFEAFVVGSNNHFAHAAALAVSQSPAKTYNPLLLIDDIHFLAGKERSQEEFFHTFDTLFDGRKQIVLSSDRPPSEIGNLEQRLVSRLDSGLTTELQPPDDATRLAILRKKAETLQVELGEEVFTFIAQHVRTNVRRLEGALMRVAAYQSLIGRGVSRETMEQLLRDTLREEAGKTLTIDQIQKKVAEHFEVRIADMTGKRRTANIVFPRQVAMYLARCHTTASFQQIGEAFGGRDHGTVLHACKTISARMKKEDPVRQTVSRFDTQLG